MTSTYARVDESSLATLDAADRVIRVHRRPALEDIPATYLEAGDYEIATINGKIRVQAPTWILWDPDGFPYPVEPSVFDKLYLREGEQDDSAAQDAERHQQRMQGLEPRSFDRADMLARVGGALLNDTGVAYGEMAANGRVEIKVGPAPWVALALALNDMAKVRWMLERVETEQGEVWAEACRLCGIDPATLEQETETGQTVEAENWPQTGLTGHPPVSAPPNVRTMPNTEHTAKPNELVVTVDDPELSHSYVYAISTDDPEVARAMAVQKAHEEDPQGKSPLNQQQLEVLGRYATVHGEERMP